MDYSSHCDPSHPNLLSLRNTACALCLSSHRQLGCRREVDLGTTEAQRRKCQCSQSLSSEPTSHTHLLLSESSLNLQLSWTYPFPAPKLTPGQAHAMSSNYNCISVSLFLTIVTPAQSAAVPSKTENPFPPNSQPMPASILPFTCGTMSLPV